MEGVGTRIVLRIWAVLILLFLFIPILLIFFYAFNTSNIETWPIAGLTTRWFVSTWNDENVRNALVVSLQAGLAATAVALVLGSCAAFAIHRARFFGREVKIGRASCRERVRISGAAVSGKITER